MDPVESPPFQPFLLLVFRGAKCTHATNAMLSVAASRSLTPSPSRPPSSLSLSSFYFHAELFSLDRSLPSFLPSISVTHSFVQLIFMSPTRNVAEGRIMARKEERRRRRKRTEETSERTPPSFLMGKISIRHNDRRRREARANLAR